MLKQLNSLTSINTFSCLGGRKVTLQTGVRVVPGSIPGSGKGFCMFAFCFVVVVLLFVVQKSLFTQMFAIFFAMFIFF